MSEQILFHIKGRYGVISDKQEEPDVVDVVNVADYEYTSGIHYIRFEEIMEETEGITETYVRVFPNKVELIRSGAVKSKMTFEEGKVNESVYYIPEGQLQMGVDTSALSVSEEEDGLHIHVHYSTVMNYEPVTDCDLIMIAEKKKQK